MRLVVSAGHNLVNDPGAVVVTSDGTKVTEAELNCSFRDALADELRRRGHSVSTPSDDLSLRDTIALCRGLPYDLALELHWNAGPPSANGMEIFYAPKASLRTIEAAHAIAKRVSKALVIKNRGVKLDSQSARGKLGFLRELPKSLLIEVGFMSNAEELSVLLRYTKDWASHVVDSLEDVLADKEKDKKDE